MALQPDADGGLDAVADLEREHALRLHVPHRAPVGQFAGMGQNLDRPAGKQPVDLARRQVELPAGRRQRRAGPALEGRLGGDRIGQPVAQGGVGVGRRGGRRCRLDLGGNFRRIGGVLVGHLKNIGPVRGVPKGIAL